MSEGMLSGERNIDGLPRSSVDSLSRYDTVYRSIIVTQVYSLLRCTIPKLF